MIFNSFSWAGPSIAKSDVLMSLHRVLPMIAQGQDKLNYRNSICLFIYIQISYLVGLLSTVMELHLHHFHMGVGLISFSTGSMIVIALTTLHMLVFTIDFYMCTLHSSLDHPCVNKFSLSLSIQWRPTFVLYWKQTLINSLYCLSSKSDCAPLQNLCLCWNCHTTGFFFLLIHLWKTVSTFIPIHVHGKSKYSKITNNEIHIRDNFSLLIFHFIIPLKSGLTLQQLNMLRWSLYSWLCDLVDSLLASFSLHNGYFSVLLQHFMVSPKFVQLSIKSSNLLH